MNEHSIALSQVVCQLTMLSAVPGVPLWIHRAKSQELRSNCEDISNSGDLKMKQFKEEKDSFPKS